MSTNDLVRFVFGVPDKSVDNFNQKITGTPTLDNTTVNITAGIKRGVGVRYASTILAGHNNTETPAANQNNGIQRSETTTGSRGLTHRERIYGIVPITMAPYDGAYPKANRQYYCYIVGLDYSTDVSLDACLGSTLQSSVYKQASTFVAGLQASSYRQESPLIRLHKTELLNLPLTSTPVAADMQAILKGITDKYYIPYSQISVAGKRIPYQWMFGAASSGTGNATTAPDIQLWNKTASVGTNPTILGGTPSEIQTREYTANDQRLLSVYCLDDDCYPIDLGYTKQITQVNTNPNPAYDTAVNNYINLNGATKTGASVAYADINAALINDPGSYTNSRHDAVLIAGETPIAVVYQDWMKATTGMLPRFIDLTNPGCNPRNGLRTFPSSRGIPNQSDPSGLSINGFGVSVSDNDTGFLLEKVNYDIGFSYYNKLLDYECNVIYADTINGLDFSRSKFAAVPDVVTAAGQNIWRALQTEEHNMPWEFSNTAAMSGDEVGRGMHINDYEIKFYYCESGIGEWLPAGSIDAAKYWFYPWGSIIFGEGFAGYGPLICTGAVADIPGGTPNGFNDYSSLPKQRYICSVVLNQRVFWFSEKDFRFSYKDNIYAYPLRNVVSSQTGKWRGGIAYSRIDQANYQGAVLVFGDSGSYSGWFTGNKFVQNVRVSANDTRGFPVDGSDFQLDFLSDSTAFSYRSAVVADGIAYWWGPQGIYSYNGVSKPVKISGLLESDVETESIFNYVDMGRDQEVHCVFSKRTSEIIWFYPPKVTDATYPTYGLVLNVESGRFYPFKFKFQVDSSQTITLENDDTPDGVDGERVLIHCRETSSSSVQRTYYFDELAQSGDQGPASQLSVISFSSPTTTTRRLTLATGSAGITASGIVANDYISFQNVKGYAPGLTLAPDMIAKITAVNNASNYIDILLPTGGAFDASATLTGQTAFPVYHRGFDSAGLNGIPYLYQTNYWLADGLYQAWVWQYLYFLFKYQGIPQPMDPFHPLEGLLARINLTFESTSGDSQTDILNLINNTKNHCQIHHPLYNQERSANGQALRFALSGIYIGDHWTFEYMEAHCLEEFGFTLKEFEG